MLGSAAPLARGPSRRLLRSCPSPSKYASRGGGSKGQFDTLCTFTCGLGYCPPGPRTCYKMGASNVTVPPKNIVGYPLPGSDCTYKGLCSFACDHGLCPSDRCTTDPGARDKCIIPAPEPDPDDPSQACTSGTGDGNFSGLCSFSCGRGFCPSVPANARA